MDAMKVEDVMTHLVVAFRPQDLIEEVAARLARNRISGAPVIEQSTRVVGVVSEADLMRRVLVEPSRARVEGSEGGSRAERECTVGDVMTLHPIVIGPEASIQEAASLMSTKDIKRLPVVDDTCWLVGIVSRADLVRAVGQRSLAASGIDSSAPR